MADSRDFLHMNAVNSLPEVYAVKKARRTKNLTPSDERYAYRFPYVLLLTDRRALTRRKTYPEQCFRPSERVPCPH